MVQSEILKMAKDGKETSEVNYFSGSRKEEINIRIRLDPNTLASKTRDASAVVNNYCYTIKGRDCNIKFTIYIRKCVLSNGTLNPVSSKRRVAIQSLPVGIHDILWTDIAKAEKDLDAAICTSWDATLPKASTVEERRT